MNRPGSATPSAEGKPPPKTPASKSPSKVHPVIIYPFIQPRDYSDLEALYHFVAGLDADKESYVRPVTVMDRKTVHSMQGNKAFMEFRKSCVTPHSELVEAWCVDTCQMWYSGLGLSSEHGTSDDISWLIPGDFNYGTAAGREVLDRMHHIPEVVAELDGDFCIGEISTDHNDSKQLIDTYATFALLYNWFGHEACEIRRVTQRPRSEFFAVRHSFLRELLQQRWYAYEQTVVILLQAVMSNKKLSRFSIGDISDLPEGRESLSAAVRQVERMERVLKSCWRERYDTKPGWAERYRQLEAQSDQVRRTAFIILEQILK